MNKTNIKNKSFIIYFTFILPLYDNIYLRTRCVKEKFKINISVITCLRTYTG